MTADPAHFAEDWCEAWNAQDLERVLAHFHDNVVFTSPTAAQIMPETGGRIHGKEALRAYWAEGLRRFPGLRFELEDVAFGVDTLVIRYRNHKGIAVHEVFVFEGDRVRFGAGTYPIKGGVAE